MTNTVQVDGICFILDTEGQMFLTYNYGFTEVIDMDMNHIGDADMLSVKSYEEYRHTKYQTGKKTDQTGKKY